MRVDENIWGRLGSVGGGLGSVGGGLGSVRGILLPSAQIHSTVSYFFTSVVLASRQTVTSIRRQIHRVASRMIIIILSYCCCIDTCAAVSLQLFSDCARINTTQF